MIGPQVKLTGSADKFLWFYLAIIGIIALVIVYFLGRSYGKSKQASGLQDEIKPDNLSYSKGQYLTFANILESAMFRPGTAEDAIYNIFRKMNNEDDVKQLITAFGSRRQELQAYTSTLGEWLTNELDTDELSQLNNILAQKNINFSF